MKFSEQMMLYSKGLSKKEVQELKDLEAQELAEAAAKEETPDAPVSNTQEETSKEEEPDYKKLYEELLKEKEGLEDSLKKAQENNIKGNSAPLTEQANKEQEDTLVSIARSFM